MQQIFKLFVDNFPIELSAVLILIVIFLYFLLKFFKSIKKIEFKDK